MLPNVNMGGNSGGSNISKQSMEELELLLLQEQHNRDLILERERDSNVTSRSGSAPPTVEGAIRAAEGLYMNPNFVQFDEDGRNNNSYYSNNNNNYSDNNNNDDARAGVFTEDEIRSHPSYLEYYYTNMNLNPRLPPPLLSKEDWRVAQRFRGYFGNYGDSWDNKNNLVDNSGNSSLFSTDPAGLCMKMVDDDDELRKAALMNNSRRTSTEFLDRVSLGSSSGMGVRRKSFADILQEGLGPRSTSNLSRPASHNSIGNMSARQGSFASSVGPDFDRMSLSPGHINAGNGSHLGDHMASGPPDNRNGPIFEIGDSISGLSISKDQQLQRYLEKSRSEKLVRDMSYTNLTRNAGSMENLNVVKDRTIFPRRTLSTTNLHSGTPPGFGHLEDLKIRCQGSNFQGTRASSNEDERELGNSSIRTGINFSSMDPRQNQYVHGRNVAHIPESSQGRHFTGNAQTFERAYLEAMLIRQRQQYESQFLLNEYHRNQRMNSLHSSSSIFHNERNARHHHHLGLRSIREEPGSSLHMHSGNNARGRFESLLELVKNNKAKSLELSDVLTHVVEFSTDQYGSRFIQQKLEIATIEEKIEIFREIVPHARALMIDVFGNYVIQKFFEHGTDSQMKELAEHVIGHVLPLSLQMYGCRVIQKALEVVDEELQSKMVKELDGSVMKCVRDQNGNHVIQKCIECVSPERIQFIMSSFVGHVVTLSTHPYGCRVIQRVLEHCVDPNTQKLIMDEIMDSVCSLAQDQYGNYVIQHVLQHGEPHERTAIINKLAGQIVKMSQQKFASNVVEKCLTYGGSEERKLLVNEILGSTDENEPLQAMMKDAFGNYVVQKVLETCNDQNRELILSRIKVHLTALKKYTYGKHIVSRIEKLVATGEKHAALAILQPEMNHF